MLNKIVLMGRLTRDPELRKTGSGVSVASFSLACERDYKQDGGEKETDFFDIVAWRNTAEFVERYFSKGRMVVVFGRLQIRTWTDNDGNNRRSAEVVAENVYFADSERTAAGAAYAPADPEKEAAARDHLAQQGLIRGAAPAPAPTTDFATIDEDDDQLPF